MNWRLSRGVKPSQCLGCPRFEKGIGFVPPDGPEDATVLGVGRHPGPIEGRTGKPYTGGAGRLFDNLLMRAGMSRQRIVVTNLVKCAGPDPTGIEIEYCMKQYFADEIKPLKDAIARGESACIVAIGGVAAKTLVNVDKIKHERGTVRSFMGIPTVITLEPAGLIWSKSEAKNMGETRDYLPIVIKDLVKVKRIATGHAVVATSRELVPHPDEAKVEEMITRVERASEYGLDVETNYPEGDGKTITMIGLSDRPGAAVTLLPWAWAKYRERLERIFADKNKMMVGWNNGQFDSWRLRDNGWKVENQLYDVMPADHLIESDMGDFSLEGAASRHLDYETWKHLTTKDPMRNCLDVSITLELKAKVHERMVELNCVDLFFRHSMPISAICAEMSRAGVRVDEEAMAKAYIGCDRISARHEAVLTEKLGPLFNRKSPKQMSTLLYEVMKLPVQKHRRTRKPTTDHYAMDDLLKIVSDPSSPPAWLGYAPILKAITEIKQFDKMKDTFFSGKNVWPDGRFHMDLLQHRQVTGRLSSQNPNVMQLPKGMPRAMIIPDKDGWVVIKADFSQIQMRLVGWFSGDPVLNERLKYYDEHPKDEFGDKQDVHRLHANRFYGDVRLDKTKRSLSKNMYYGIQFGQGARGLAVMYGVDEMHAQNFINFLWTEYPHTKRWRDGIINSIEERNYLRNPYGRLRWLWNKNFATEAFIALPQMTEADMLFESLIELRKTLPSPARIMFPVHDEIVTTCPHEMAEDVASMMVRVMSKPRETLDGFNCPAESQIGLNYYEASHEVGMAGDWRRLRRQVR